MLTRPSYVVLWRDWVANTHRAFAHGQRYATRYPATPWGPRLSTARTRVHSTLNTSR